MVSMLSDKGAIRSLNEDSCKYYECEKFNIYVVADGMGGHNAGEVASKMAVDGIVNFIKDNVDIISENKLLKEAINFVNTIIYNYSCENQELNGMGTTITSCLVINDMVYVANVGDSSSFGIKGKVIKKITKDHSLVQELVDLGTISEYEAINHPKKNIITRAVGTSKSVDVDIFEVPKNDYDLFLLCTDGLTNEVTNEQIISVMLTSESFNEACSNLIEIAKQKGGRDNITVLLFGGEN